MRREFLVAAVIAATAITAGANAHSSEPPPPQSSTVHPDWAAPPFPIDLERAYPAEALRRHVNGHVTLRCSDERDGHVDHCAVIEETPPGMGFGVATLLISERFRMKPYRGDEGPGGPPPVVIPIGWKIAPEPAKAATSEAGSARSEKVEEPFPGFFAFFPVYFIAVWLAATTVLSLMSGWFGLMERYPDRREPALAKEGSLSGTMGWGVGLRGILTLGACQAGLRVTIWRIFGPFCRPLFVPWREITVRPITYFFQPMVRLSFGNPEQGVLRIDARVWERLSGAARQSVGAAVPPAHPVSEGRLVRSAFLQWLAATAFAATFFYFTPRLMEPKGESLPLAICIGFPAIVFGIGQLFRYARQGRRS